MSCIDVNEIFKDEKENIIIVFEDNRERKMEFINVSGRLYTEHPR
jgi:hypothetical protein